jgi:hypothetical protein
MSRTLLEVLSDVMSMVPPEFSDQTLSPDQRLASSPLSMGLLVKIGDRFFEVECAEIAQVPDGEGGSNAFVVIPLPMQE